MKAQISAISLILISGMVIALVGAAYMWGVPLIEKRGVVTEFQTSQSFMFNLNDLIVSMANSGAGRESVTIPRGLVRVIPASAQDPDNNSIIFQFGVNQPIIFNQTPVYIGGATFEDVISEIGTYGVSSPGVISMTSVKDAGGYMMKLKLHFRELDTRATPQKGYKIILETASGSAESGTTSMTLAFQRQDTQQSGCCGGSGPLSASRIKVELA